MARAFGYPRHMGDETANLGVHARPPAPPAAVMPALKDKAKALSAPFEKRHLRTVPG